MAKLIDLVIGHQEEKDQLRLLLERQRWPHALLFSGPNGVGKRKLALAFAQALICPDQAGGEACGRCGPCHRVAQMQSESLYLIQPEDGAAAGRETIKVDSIRQLLEGLSLMGLGVARVVIIDQAERMNAQAANALLKTLEEPFPKVYFILLSRAPQALLPTIRSRVQVLRFSPLSLDSLRLIRPGCPEWTYMSARGQVDQLDWLNSKEGAERREEALGLFVQFCEDPQFLLSTEWKALLKDRVNALFSIRCWLQIVRDLLILKSQARRFVMNTDQVERLKRLYQLQTKKLQQLAQGLVQAEQSLKGNADALLVFENMWVNYARMD